QFIESCMVVGQDKRFLGVLIVPSLLEFRLAGFQERSLAELAENDIARKIIKNEIKQIILPAKGYKKYEQIRDFYMLKEHFQVGEELTNLFKLRRHVIDRKFAVEIASLFENETIKKS
ncbi:MAG: long-chain fatty acid--CoA ligase, partial [Bacteroidetes bacterium]|nr:long-chain fatty acid--CoA ligase [Bacteroidota bacterium]